jgi:hypothetical protein
MHGSSDRRHDARRPRLAGRLRESAALPNGQAFPDRVRALALCSRSRSRRSRPGSSKCCGPNRRVGRPGPAPSVGGTPPLANDRLHILPEGAVRLDFKKPWSDGTCSVDLEPLAFIARLAALVPPPRRHLTRYVGVLSSHSKLGRAAPANLLDRHSVREVRPPFAPARARQDA